MTSFFWLCSNFFYLAYKIGVSTGIPRLYRKTHSRMTAKHDRIISITLVNITLDFIDYICNRNLMSEEKKQISIAESKVMETLWRAHPLTAEDVTNGVAADQNWSVGTVKSLLNRLLSKGAISAEKDGRRYLYSPVLSHDDYITHEGQGVLDRLFDGRVSALLTHFSQHEKLSGDDIAELKKLIKELDDDK